MQGTSQVTDPGLTKINGELFNLRRILKLLEGAKVGDRYRSERVLVELVARLIRVQQQRIQELGIHHAAADMDLFRQGQAMGRMKLRIQFLEKDALAADVQHRSELEAYGLLKQRHQELNERYDLLMQRTKP